MATFARSTFSTANYAAARPSYPQSLYDFLLSVHKGPRNHLLDLGTGHGVVARQFAPSFKNVTACDPSSGMLDQARSLSDSPRYANLTYRQDTAEFLPFLEDGSIDVVTSAQAAHWFDFSKAWPELARVVRQGGTLAFWGYGLTAFQKHLKVTDVVLRYAFQDGGEIAKHWPQPGSGMVDNRYRDIMPPRAEWEELSRIVYEPVEKAESPFVPPLRGLTNEPYRAEVISKESPLKMTVTRKVGDMLAFFRSWSATKEWAEVHPEQKSRAEGGNGDIVDQMFDEIVEVDAAWKDLDLEVEVDLGTCLVIARRK